MKVHGKLGTHPSDVFSVKGKRKPLVVGERVKISSRFDSRCYSWTCVIVDKINEDGFVFFSFE